MVRHVYNLKKVIKLYVKGYYDFLVEKSLLTEDSEDLYKLFSYSLKTMYKLPCYDGSNLVSFYSEDCIKYLKSIKYTPRRVDKIAIESRVELVTMCLNYFVAVDYNALRKSVDAQKR